MTALPPSPVSSQALGRSLCVLIAEDNPINRLLLVAHLKQLGHDVLIAHNGREAIHFIEQGSPIDLILMDVQMPEMDGFRATAVIRLMESGTGRRVPIVALTASTMDGDREECFRAGMDEYLTKPILPQTLEMVLFRISV